MKVKRKDNGNVRITLTEDEARRLRSTLLETRELQHRNDVSIESADVADALDSLLYLDLGLNYIR